MLAAGARRGPSILAPLPAPMTGKLNLLAALLYRDARLPGSRGLGARVATN